MPSIFLCAISNIKSGACNQDCSFCTQSIKHGADITRYKSKALETIIHEAHCAKSNGATGFCLVSSGKSLTSEILLSVCEAAAAIGELNLGLKLIACNGTATYEQLQTLKNAGIHAYNHNLETAQSYYPQICSTHTWKERYETCVNVKKAGLNLVSGGIFGIGESPSQRIELFESLSELEPNNVPLNFFHHNPSLPLPASNLDTNEALYIVEQARKMIPKAQKIMLAGGRSLYFGLGDYRFFERGANAMVIGNYLTTKGHNALDEVNELKNKGYTIIGQSSTQKE